MDLPELVEGVLERRYQRFLADVRLAGGERVVAHCPNTGAMTGLNHPGSRVWLVPNSDPRRKLRWTWELVETADGIACVHSARANDVVAETLAAGRLPGFESGWQVQREVRVGGHSRIDFRMHRGDDAVLLEVKAVTLRVDNGLGLFPDAPSERALRHVELLQCQAKEGRRSVLLFCVLHTGITRVAPAAAIHPAYADALVAAVAAGVDVRAVGCNISPNAIEAIRVLPVEGIQS